MAYKKYNKQKISQNTKAIITIATLGIAITGIEGMEYLKDKQMIEYQLSKAEKTNIKSLSEIQEELLREKAVKFNVNEILDKFAVLDYEQSKKLEESITDKYVEVTGEICQIKTDNYLYADHFTMRNSDPSGIVSGYGGVYCEIEDEKELSKLKELESGDIITVNGYCDDIGVITVNIYDCEIINVQKDNGVNRLER